MATISKQTIKKLAVIVHDLVVTALAIPLVFFVRFEGLLLDERMRYLPSFLPFFVVYAGAVYWFFSLYRSKWRFASLPDLSNIVRAVSILSLTLLVADYVLIAPNIYGAFYFGKITIALYWLVQIALLGGPRLAYRYFKYSRSKHQAQRDAALPALILGRGVEVEMVIRAMESGTPPSAGRHPLAARRRSRPVDPRRARARPARADRDRGGRRGRARRGVPPHRGGAQRTGAGGRARYLAGAHAQAGFADLAARYLRRGRAR
jgi:hypothetical protein